MYMEEKATDSPLMRVKKRLINLQSLIDDSYTFGLISKKDWERHRALIREIRTIKIEKILKEYEEYGNEASY